MTALVSPWLMAAAVVLLPGAAAANPVADQAFAPVRVPASATLNYQVTGRIRGFSYDASAQLQWRRQGERYDAVWSIGLPLLGTQTQHSEGRITEAGLAPERYVEKWRKERAATFDAEGQRIHYTNDRPDAVLESGAQDRLSITLQLAALLAAAPERYPPGTRITLQTSGVRDAEPWTWDVLADQSLPVAGRDISCARLVRQPRMENDTGVELWLARTLNYLPVRLILTQSNGDVADQQLQTIDKAPASR